MVRRNFVAMLDGSFEWMLILVWIEPGPLDVLSDTHWTQYDDWMIDVEHFVPITLVASQLIFAVRGEAVAEVVVDGAAVPGSMPLIVLPGSKPVLFRICEACVDW